jgi:protein-tyrosine phosphatase
LSVARAGELDASVVTDVLFVCTANLCRSPMAAEIFRHRLGERSAIVTIASAGLLEPDLPAVEGVRRALVGRGLDAGDHRSRRLDAELVRGADLILGLERQHVREVVVLDPATWSRAFTLKEIVRRGEAAGPREAGEPWPRWLDRVHFGRQRADLLGSSPDDDVADPMGGALEDYEATADELDDLLSRLVDVGWPPGV